jgi:hypothetical protein
MLNTSTTGWSLLARTYTCAVPNLIGMSPSLS